MKRKALTGQPVGFTLVEICISLAVSIAVGALAYTMLISSTTLLAKNLSLNASNTTVRTTLDRIFSEINQANKLPTLVNADGTPASTTTAAGILVDRYVGGPYIVGNPGSGIPASATSFKLFYSTDTLANPPPPVKNDVVIMDGVTRALVASSSAPTAPGTPAPNPTPSPGAMVTVTLQSNLGSYTNPPITSGNAIPWLASTQQTAYVAHRRAFVVVPVNGVDGPPAELRMYPDAENLTAVINDPTKYVVLTREIGTNTYNGLPEYTPFSVVTQSGASFVNIAMRVEDQQFNKRLSTQGQQGGVANTFNTFLRVDTMSRPRNNP